MKILAVLNRSPKVSGWACISQPWHPRRLGCGCLPNSCRPGVDNYFGSGASLRRPHLVEDRTFCGNLDLFRDWLRATCYPCASAEGNMWHTVQRCPISSDWLIQMLIVKQLYGYSPFLPHVLNVMTLVPYMYGMFADGYVQQSLLRSKATFGCGNSVSLDLLMEIEANLGSS